WPRPRRGPREAVGMERIAGLPEDALPPAFAAPGRMVAQTGDDETLKTSHKGADNGQFME
ncbi:MAG: hypothetical protein H7X97_12625, partial [Opitutaceae bacterium]|nr:hypothetical protein [Verrucomicrobiales bacterium]